MALRNRPPRRARRRSPRSPTIGTDKVLTDTATRAYYANDVFWQPGIEPLAVDPADDARGGGAAVLRSAPRRGSISSRAAAA